MEIGYNIISSSSAGNAVIIQKSVLIDVGVSYKKIEPYMDDVKLVLITHRHQDHFRPSTVRRMALEKPLLRFGCGDWMVDELIKSGVAKGQIDVLREKMLYGYGICNVIPFSVFHDVPCYGYKIHLPQGKVFYATDLGNTAGLSAKGYDLIMLENNYEEDDLRARMDEKKAAGKFAYEQRVVKYHLSKKQCDDFIYRNVGKNSEYVYLHCHVERGSDEGTNSWV